MDGGRGGPDARGTRWPRVRNTQKAGRFEPKRRPQTSWVRARLVQAKHRGGSSDTPWAFSIHEGHALESACPSHSPPPSSLWRGVSGYWNLLNHVESEMESCLKTLSRLRRCSSFSTADTIYHPTAVQTSEIFQTRRCFECLSHAGRRHLPREMSSRALPGTLGQNQH